jgi:hypothetical protein
MSNLPDPGRGDKPSRLIGWLTPPTADAPGVLRIVKDHNETRYEAQEIPCDLGGRAFELSKLDGADLGEVYHVLLKGRESSCTCKGFSYRQRPCKHIQGLEALVVHDQLPRLLRKQKHVCCPLCLTVSPDLAPGLCPACQEEEDRFAAYFGQEGGAE